MTLADRVLANTVNVLSLIYAHVHFPVYTNGLKEVGRHLGCAWTDPDASLALLLSINRHIQAD